MLNVLIFTRVSLHVSHLNNYKCRLLLFFAKPVCFCKVTLCRAIFYKRRWPCFWTSDLREGGERHMLLTQKPLVNEMLRLSVDSSTMYRGFVPETRWGNSINAQAYCGCCLPTLYVLGSGSIVGRR